MNAIQTLSGKLVSLLDPDPRDILIEDIAGQLAKINRFVGATRVPYSVAQHCCVLAQHVPRKFALEGLLHDASEYLTGDLSRPLKVLLGDAFKRVEENIEYTIAKKFGCVWEWPNEVHEADTRMLVTEHYGLMNRAEEAWIPNVTPYPEGFGTPWSWQEAERAFLYWYEQLRRV